MKISTHTIDALKDIVTGDSSLSPYLSGPKLVKLFNKYGFGDTYGQGFPSRWKYAEEKITQLNESEKLRSLIIEVFDPRRFMSNKLDIYKALEAVNKRLFYDGYEVIIKKGYPRIKDIKEDTVTFTSPNKESTNDTHIYIEEQIEKCDEKIALGDYDGAITNARSLVESVLKDVEKRVTSTDSTYDGNVLKLYKRVQKELNLDPSSDEIDNSLKQVLTGLISILNGLSNISNVMGDRHARPYKPSKHHAILIVNCSKTFCQFIYDTFEYQARK